MTAAASKRWRGLRRLSRVGFAASVALVPVAWMACAGSYLVEWSCFTAGPPRPRAAGPLNAVPGGAGGPLVERDETHWMFGHGRVAIVSSTVYTSTFDHPAAAINSRVLAWATFDDWFIGGPWRFGRYPQGPVMGVSLWVPAAAVTCVGVAALVLRSRRPRPGQCVRCRYDLRATAERADTAGRCPECGTVQRCPACGRTLEGVLGCEACPGCGWIPQRSGSLCE